MNPNFIPPSISDGVSHAVVERKEVMTMKLSWKATCAMFVVGYQPSMAIFTKFLKSSWPHLENLKPILHDDGYCLVKCD